MTRFYLFLTTIAFIFNENYAKPVYQNDSVKEDGADDENQYEDDDWQSAWEKSGKFEGDIVMAPLERNGRIRDSSKWPNGDLPYKFATNHFTQEQQNFIVNALEEFRKQSCINPRPATEFDEDYILVTGNQSGCFSTVGRVGRVQTLNLRAGKVGRGCLTVGGILHEFLHALGFYHQQSTTNRDDYITIVWENVDKRAKRNFQKYERDIITDFDQVYDYGSVLHYGPYAFSKNREETIITKDSSAKIGQRKKMSDIDVIKLNKMYNCQPKNAPRSIPTPQTQLSQIPTAKDGTESVCAQINQFALEMSESDIIALKNIYNCVPTIPQKSIQIVAPKFSETAIPHRTEDPACLYIKQIASRMNDYEVVALKKKFNCAPKNQPELVPSKSHDPYLSSQILSGNNVCSYISQVSSRMSEIDVIRINKLYNCIPQNTLKLAPNRIPPLYQRPTINNRARSVCAQINEIAPRLSEPVLNNLNKMYNCMPQNSLNLPLQESPTTSETSTVSKYTDYIVGYVAGVVVNAFNALKSMFCSS